MSREPLHPYSTVGDTSMARLRWKLVDDKCLSDWFDLMGDFVGEHDLARPKGAATRRVKHLKKTGAWDVLGEMSRLQNEHRQKMLKLELSYAEKLGWNIGEGLDEEGVYHGPAGWRGLGEGED